ncbi:MAG TPA: amidohydrolase family protein [Gemmatimonadales bacterium]|nr:amidohydrolase family protein [Gemmatimonadales bacterium]
MGRTALAVHVAAALLLSACAGARPSPAPVAPRDPVTAISDAMLWDGSGRAPVPHAVTLVRGERILCAGSLGECPVPEDARVIDAKGGWLIPGLIDTHVHLLFLQRGSAGAELGDDLKDLLAQGITAVRDMGTNPKELLARTRAQAAAPRVYAMQLVAGFRFFYGRETVTASDGTVGYRMPPAQVMQLRGWTPLMYRFPQDADAIVAEAVKEGAAGLKLYGFLDAEAVQALVGAAGRAGLPVWGHAWVQPAGPRELVEAGEDGLVHASLFVGDLFSAAQRDSLTGQSSILAAGARVATAEAALDPQVLETLDSMARRGTFFEPTLDVTLRSVAHFDAEGALHPTVSEEYARATAGFSMALTREAVRRGVRLVAGTDHVAYGRPSDRASLLPELALLTDSIGLSPQEALLAATRDAATALGGTAAQSLGRVEAGRYADLVLLGKNPLEDIRNLGSVEWVMQGGKIWKPWQLRSGIAAADRRPDDRTAARPDGQTTGRADARRGDGEPALTRPGTR